jgi:predicted negative regulator of RcsB-dependent stress response
MMRALARRLTIASAAFALALPLQSCAGQSPDALRDRAAEALRTGKYDEARSMYEGLAGRAEATAADRRGLIAVLHQTGAYEEAEQRARVFAQTADSAAVLVPLGDVLLARGNRPEAERAFQRAIAVRSGDSLTARLRLAGIQLARNERSEAYRALDAFIDAYNAARPGTLTSDELVAVGSAVRMLGARDPQLFKDARRQY